MEHILDKYQGGRVAGKFSLAGNTQIFGELSLKGPQTSLYLRHDAYFATNSLPDKCITGVLLDLTRVTLLDCFVTSNGSASRYDESYRQASVSPQFVIFGDSHIVPGDQVIQSLSFTIDDATTLFHDHDAFGTIFDATPYISRIVNSCKPDWEIVIGPHPQIQFFTGRLEIVRAETCLGTITASHNPTWGFGSPAGVQMNNKITVTLAFDNAIGFFEAVGRIYPLWRFFELMVGRPQNIQDISIKLPDLNDRKNFLEVYWVRPLKRDKQHEGREPHLQDILLSPIFEPTKFSTVMIKWLAEDSARQISRVRFSQVFGLQRYYPIDRMVGAANMFDHLPEEAAPAATAISPDVQEAKKKSRELFRALPESLERDALLQALGRIGKSSLKHKVRHRAAPIVLAIGSDLNDLNLVIDEAINCRNYFVHGGRSAFDYSDHLGVVVFLNDTLEFVFAVSDLMDAGWDIGRWRMRSSGLSHPFADYCHNYERNLLELRNLLKQ